MSTTPNRPPLWVLIPEAFTNSAKEGGPTWTVRDGIAAELRAIAGELENHKGFLVDGYNLSPEGKAIAAWLLAEADRAEAVE